MKKNLVILTRAGFPPSPGYLPSGIRGSIRKYDLNDWGSPRREVSLATFLSFRGRRKGRGGISFLSGDYGNLRPKSANHPFYPKDLWGTVLSFVCLDPELARKARPSVLKCGDRKVGIAQRVVRQWRERGYPEKEKEDV